MTNKRTLPEMTTFGMYPELEPVAYLVLFEGAGKLLEFKKGNYIHGAKVEHIPLYTTPPQREWQGLTDDEVDDIGCDFATLGGDIEGKNWFAFYLAIEAKLKEKNA